MLIVPGLFMGSQTRGGRVYLLADGITCVLIDTGAFDGTLGAGQLIEEAHRQPHEVRLVLLTHAHPGHAGNAAGLCRLTNAPLAASAAVGAELAEPRPRRRRGPLGLLGVEEPLQAARVTREVEPGETIDIAGGIEVLDAPGHAPGALAFRLHGPDALCAGDALQLDPTGLRPPPRRHCADASAAAATARALAALEVHVVAPGHGFPSIDGRLPRRHHGRDSHRRRSGPPRLPSRG